MAAAPVKNLRRSDPEIFGDARRALDRRRTVPDGVHLHVVGGVATLTGTVYQPFERAEAEDAIRGIEGIARIVNDLVVTKRVGRNGFEPPDEEC